MATNKKKANNMMLKEMNDLKGGLASFYGVVTYFREPQKTRGTDYSMTLRVTDPTWGKDPLCCIMFAKTVEALPAVQSVDDIMRFHRVKVTTYNGKLQCQSAPGYAVLVFKSNSDEPASTTLHYSYTDEDKEKVKELQQWSRSQNFSRQTTNPAAAAPKSIECIRNITEKKYFDLSCQVAAIHKVADKHFVFKVWDGTKSPNSLRHPTTNDPNCLQIAEISPVGHPGIQWYGDFKNIITDYLVDVSVFDDHIPAAKTVRAGDYVRFTNLHSLVPKAPDPTNPSATTHVEICLHHGMTFNRGLRLLRPEEIKPLEDKMKPVLSTVAKQKKNSEAPRKNKTVHGYPTINEFQANTYFDFICQVMAIRRKGPDHVVFKVCDGTEHPSNLMFTEVTANNHPDLVWLEGVQGMVDDYMIDVSVFGDHVKYVDEVKPGAYIAFTNLNVFVPEGQDEDIVKVCLHAGTNHNRGFRIVDGEAANVKPRMKFLMMKMAGEIPESSQSQSQSQESHQLDLTTADASSCQQEENQGQKRPKTSGTDEDVSPSKCAKQSEKKTGQPSVCKASISSSRQTETFQKSVTSGAKQFERDEECRLADLAGVTGRVKSFAKSSETDSRQRDGQPAQSTSGATSAQPDKQMDRLNNNRQTTRQTEDSQSSQIIRQVACDRQTDGQDEEPKSTSSQRPISSISDVKELDPSGQLVCVKAQVTDISAERASEAFILHCANCNFMSHYYHKGFNFKYSTKTDVRNRTLEEIQAALQSSQDEMVYYELKDASQEDFDILRDTLYILKARRCYEAKERIPERVCSGAWMKIMKVEEEPSDGLVQCGCPVCAGKQTDGSTKYLVNKLVVEFTLRDASGQMQVAWIQNMENHTRQHPDVQIEEILQNTHSHLSKICSFNEPLHRRCYHELLLLLPKEGQEENLPNIVKCSSLSVGQFFKNE